MLPHSFSGLYTGNMIACRFFYLFLFLGLLLSPFAVAEGAVVSGAVRAEMKGVLADCLSLADERDVCYATACEYEPGYLCAEDVLDVATEIAGPEQAIGVLHEIMESPIFAITSDGHLLSHVVGRANSRIFGSSGENFLRCPHDFNDGCYHGFFEDTLVKVDDPVAVAVQICEGMPPETTSGKEKGYCYHGAGHVFLMQASYDLDAGIAACVSVPERWQNVCLSGVFMENAWPTRDWEAKSANFREDDPLYPCNTIDEDFRSVCYMEHYSYLMHAYTTSFDGLVEICSQAGDNVGDCLSGVGLMLQNSQRTNAVFSSFGVADRPYMEKIIFLCNQFPEGHASSCYIPLVGALLNFDYPSMDRVSVFCGGIAEEHRTACFRRAGSYLNHLGSEEVKRSACSKIPALYRGDCLRSGTEYSEVVVSEFAEGVSTANTSSDDEADRLGRFVGVVTHFFTDLFNVLSSLFARPASAQSADDSALSDALFSGVEQCRRQSGSRAECYAALCEYEPGYLCAEEILEAVTREVAAGPEVGMQVLQEVVASPLFDLSIGDSGHSLAHVVGRVTARHIGMDGEAFLRCPTSFDYGCVHGFLEISLAESSSPAEAILEVCESLPEKPGIGRPNCYHGSGHGVMMNVSYNLDEALAICDALPDSYGCWGGVFMENNSGYRRILELYPEHNSFDEHNLLAPCNVVDEKYRTTCFRVHILYLGEMLQHDVDAVVATCLSAGEYVEDCVFGFGWHILFEDLQDAFLPGTDMNFIEKTIYLCDKFPEQYRGICYRPAVNQITVSYGAERTFEFCEKVKEQYVRDCYQEIGKRLDDLILHQDEKVEACASVPERYRDDCLHGRERRERVDPSSEGDLIVSDPIVERAHESSLSRLVAFLRNAVSSILTMFSRPVSAQSGADLQDGVRRCLSLERDRDVCYASLCDGRPSQPCAWDIVRAITFLTGADDATAAAHHILFGDVLHLPDPKSKATGLHTDRWGGAFGIDPTYGHDMLRAVGEALAERFGLTRESILRCPNDFDYGCQRGFLEYALSQVAFPPPIISELCESMPDVPRVAKGNCYYGAGHGLMLHHGYDLQQSLAWCDEAGGKRSSCWFGVFYENVFGIMKGRITADEKNGFRTDNPFAPCNQIDERYKFMCYKTHAPYLMFYYDNDFEKVVAACVHDAEQKYRAVCAEDVGSYIRVSGIQRLVPDSVDAGDTFIEKSVYLCDTFPDYLRVDCYAGIIKQNIIDYGIDGISGLCASVAERHRKKCWQIIGERVISIAANEDEKRLSCSVAPAMYRDDCLFGYDSSSKQDDMKVSEDSDVREVDDSADDSWFARIVTSLRLFLSHFLSVFARPVSAETVVGAAPVFSADALQNCLDREPDAACYASLCEYEPGYLCAEDIVDAVTVSDSPKRAVAVLHFLEESPAFTLSGKTHQLAHGIGRAISRHYGMNGESFLLCPDDFQYGCYHGFFEHALLETDSPLDAAKQICGMFPDDAFDDIFYCYHGMGHGIMMNEGHNLYASLALCDLLPDKWQRTCWDGVFMQNVIGYSDADSPYTFNTFDTDDPLAPCSVVDDKYRPACYRKHAQYLFSLLDNSPSAVVRACDEAGDWAEDCAGGFGEIIVTHGSKRRFLSDEKGSYSEQIASLCYLFATDEAILECITRAAIDMSLYYDFAVVVDFCNTVEVDYRHKCFRGIHSGYITLNADAGESEVLCAVVPEAYQDDCLFGRRGGRDTVSTPSHSSVATLSSEGERKFGFWRNLISALFSFLSDVITSRKSHVVGDGQDAGSVRSAFSQKVSDCLALGESEDISCYTSLCEYELGYLCAEKIIDAVTALQGPEVGIRVLRGIVDDPAFPVGGNTHQLAHTVGRSAARHWGGTGDVFNRCPAEFGYGCLHGFFEDAMLQAELPDVVLTTICESHSSKSSFESYERDNCYHGGGHGLMMNESYDLDRALAVCDLLSSKASACWGGVFMENVMGFVDGRVPEEHSSFDESNPLAPCDIVDEKYRNSCYLYHRVYLVHQYSDSVDDLVRVCLGAGDHVAVCLQGLVRAVRDDVIAGLHSSSGSTADRLLSFCQYVPEQYLSACHRSAVDEVLYPDSAGSLHAAVRQAVRYCGHVGTFQEACFIALGRRLDRFVADWSEKKALCEMVPETFFASCAGDAYLPS